MNQTPNIYGFVWNPNINHYMNQLGLVVDDSLAQTLGLPVPPYTGTVLTFQISGSTIILIGLAALIFFK